MNNPERKYLVTVDEIMVKPQNSPYLTGVVFKGESIGNHGIYIFFSRKHVKSTALRFPSCNSTEFKAVCHPPILVGP